jgi:hypothetical protein
MMTGGMIKRPPSNRFAGGRHGEGAAEFLVRSSASRSSEVWRESWAFSLAAQFPSPRFMECAPSAKGSSSMSSGSKSPKIDDADARRRFAAEAETHTRGNVRANEARPESATAESVRA